MIKRLNRKLVEMKSKSKLEELVKKLQSKTENLKKNLSK